ncbi:MAG: SRPBCC domain-containing protein [Planctomycetales bacterium]
MGKRRWRPECEPSCRSATRTPERRPGHPAFTNFTTGQSHSFGGEYLELAPHERIRHTDEFDDPNLPGAMQVTVAFKKVSCGTEVNITQEGVPDVIPAEACYLGWQESLALLAKLVEAEIPDET